MKKFEVQEFIVLKFNFLDWLTIIYSFMKVPSDTEKSKMVPQVNANTNMRKIIDREHQMMKEYYIKFSGGRQLMNLESLDMEPPNISYQVKQIRSNTIREIGKEHQMIDEEAIKYAHDRQPQEFKNISIGLRDGLYSSKELTSSLDIHNLQGPNFLIVSHQPIHSLDNLFVYGLYKGSIIIDKDFNIIYSGQDAKAFFDVNKYKLTDLPNFIAKSNRYQILQNFNSTLYNKAKQFTYHIYNKKVHKNHIQRHHTQNAHHNNYFFKNISALPSKIIHISFEFSDGRRIFQNIKFIQKSAKIQCFGMLITQAKMSYLSSFDLTKYKIIQKFRAKIDNNQKIKNRSVYGIKKNIKRYSNIQNEQQDTMEQIMKAKIISKNRINLASKNKRKCRCQKQINVGQILNSNHTYEVLEQGQNEGMNSEVQEQDNFTPSKQLTGEEDYQDEIQYGIQKLNLEEYIM